jgi:hypothetical protein
MSIRPVLAACLLAPCAALADFPLLSEDTGVLGKGAWQFEAEGSAVKKNADFASLVLGYGAAETVDLQIELPYVERLGWLDPVLELKWRFFDREPFSMAVKHVVSNDLWGGTLAASLLLGDFEVLAGGTFLRNDVVDEARELRRASLAVLWSASETFKVIVDFVRDTNIDAAEGGHHYAQVIGVSWSPTPDVDLGIGVRERDERGLLLGVKLRW